MRAGKLLAGCSAVAVLAGASAAQADLEISNHPTLNVSCASGVCTATADKARLNVADLAGMLAAGDVAVKTGSVTADIELRQPLSWTSASRLTLDAKRSVEIDRPMSVTGSGALTIVTNDGGKNGEFIVFPERGSVQFWDLNSSLVIDGHAYTLAGDIKTLASDIAANPSGFYALAKDYDASADGTYSTSPIPTPFRGAFEGLGNKVVSVSISSSIRGDSVGFFDGADTGGIIQNFSVAKETVYASDANEIGLLAGGNFGRIVRCRVSGRISFPLSVGVGGLVGENDASIVDSSSDVRIVGSKSAEAVGGLVGFNAGDIVSSFATKGLTLKFASQINLGGVIGDNLGAIENSFSRTHLAERQDSAINFGGLVGKNDAGATIKSAYAAGPMTLRGGEDNLLGGLVGVDFADSGSISHGYWDLDMGVSDPSQGAGNVENDPGITGLTTGQFQAGLPNGFDPKIWGQNPKINDGFPYLLANRPK